MDREMSVVPPDRNGNGVRSVPSGQAPAGDHVVVTIGEPQQSPRVLVEEGLAEQEIRSLLWMEQKGNEVLRRAYVEWEKKDVLFANRIDKKKKQSNSFRNEIYQLIGFYSVFQGVLLTAVAQSNWLFCHNWWCAFFLSFFASLVTIAGVLQKFRAILALEKTILNETDTRQECIKRATKLRQKRGEFRFDRDALDGKDRQFDQTRVKFYIALVGFILVVFSGLFLVSIVRVLCYPVSTKFVNKTAYDFKLKEANAGVYRDLAVLKGTADPNTPDPQGHCTVVLDAHATYPKYTVVAVGHNSKEDRVLVSSDMCQDSSVVNIVKNSTTGKCETKCEPRVVETGKDSEPSVRSGASPGGNKFSWLFEFVRNRSK